MQFTDARVVSPQIFHSTYRAKAAGIVEVEKTLDDSDVCQELQGEI